MFQTNGNIRSTEPFLSMKLWIYFEYDLQILLFHVVHPIGVTTQSLNARVYHIL